MKILLEQPNGRYANKRDKKSRKILKKMAKLEKKLHKYVEDVEGEVSLDESSSSDSSRDGRSSRRHCRSRSSSTSSSSSSSCSSRSPSPKHRRHGHLVRSRSLFVGRGSRSPVPISREDRRHHHRRHHSSHHREFHGRPRHHHHQQHYFRRCNNVVEGGLFRNLALSDDLQNDRQRLNREPEVVDIEMDDNLQETTGDLENQVDDVVTGLEIEESLAENWKEVVQNGLSKDKSKELVDKYPINRNRHGLLLQGPKLNKEIAYVVSDASVFKDTSKLTLQNEVGIGLSALGQAISILNNKPELEQDTEIVDVVEKLNDAATILLGTHYNLTKARQLDLKAQLRWKAQTVLETCKHDEFLFGKGLEDKSKNAKGFEKCKKMWKHGNRGEMTGKRKHACQEGEKRKSKRSDVSATSH